MVSESFKIEVVHTLRSGVNRRCSFSVLFRTDIFKFLFGGKGNDCPHRLGRFYNLEDFDGESFSPEWYKCYDRLGNGCTIEFPLVGSNALQSHCSFQLLQIVSGYLQQTCIGLIPCPENFRMLAMCPNLVRNMVHKTVHVGGHILLLVPL